jgi:hypothetical protein
MSQKRRPDLSRLVVAAFSRHDPALAWAQARLSEAFGPVARCSDDYHFHHTSYYEPTMGGGLKKRLIVFEPLIPSDVLPEAKNFAIGLENDLACRGGYPEARPINLDPGLLQLGKFLLASTKDQGHRIYLRDGIYAEVTLRFEGKEFVPWPWTYADYREPMVREILRQAREELRVKLAMVE